MLGNLELVRSELRRDLEIGDIVDHEPSSPLDAEIVAGVTPLWHAIEVHPNHERSVAAYLVARRFGMFVPETEDDIIRRGRKLHVTRLMFTGYVFVFVWDILEHKSRIEAIPGVVGIVRQRHGDGPAAGRPIVIKDEVIDQIRAVENSKRPLRGILIGDVISKKKKGRYRKSRRDPKELEEERGNEIVSCRAWSPFQDGLLSLDADGRNQTLLTALGLSS